MLSCMVLFFGGLFVWVVLCLLETGQCHPNSERSTVLLCCQLPTDFHNMKWCLWCLSVCCIVWCWWTIFRTQWRSSKHLVCLRERSGYLWYTLASAHILQSALVSGQKARIVLIDFTATIDRVNHQGILNKLCSVRIGGSVLSMLTQFISNRSQHVMVLW